MASPRASLVSRSSLTGHGYGAGGVVSPKSLLFAPRKTQINTRADASSRQRGSSPVVDNDREGTRTAESSTMLPPSPTRNGARVATTRAALECVPFLARWINHLCGGHLGWTPLTRERFFEDLKSGLVICRLVERLVPSVDFSVGLSMRPKTRKACVGNIERALAVVWKQGVKSSQMCTADDIYDCEKLKVARCLVEIFDVLQMRLREVRLKARETISALHGLLSRVGRPLSDQTVQDPIGFSSFLLADFADGIRVMSLLVYFDLARSDKERQMRSCCVLAEHWQANGTILTQSLSNAGCPALLGPTEWAQPPPPFPDTTVYQLHALWNHLKKREHGALHTHPKNETKEECMKGFFHFLLQHYPSLADACRAMTPGRTNRISRTDFMKAMRTLSFPGDAKFVWHCLDKHCDGYIGVAEFSNLEYAVMSQLAQDSLRIEDTEENDHSLYTGYSQADTEQLSSPYFFHTNSTDAGSAESIAWDQAAQDHSVAQITLLVKHPEAQGSEWPSPMIDEVVAMSGGTQVRLPSYAEERTRLLAEDERRLSELYEKGAVTAARRVASAASAACRAAVQAADEHTEADLEAADREDLGPAPTTSIEARVVLADKSERRIWVQTSVVDSEDGDGESATVMVLELRELSSDGVAAQSESTECDAPLRVQINVERIIAVEQLSAIDASSDEPLDVKFVVAFHNSADMLALAPKVPEQERQVKGSMRPEDLRRHVLVHTQVKKPSAFFQDGKDGNSILYIVAGASAWRRREAARFFDELRILAHFLANQEAVVQRLGEVVVDENAMTSDSEVDSDTS